MTKRFFLLAVILLSPSLVLAQTDASPPPEPPAAAPLAPTATVSKLFEPKFGVVFNLQNIFQNPGLLSGFRGGIGLQFSLSQQLALRLGVSLAHTSNPPVVTETVVTINDVT